MASTFIVGLDLGQAQDFTALACIERITADPPPVADPLERESVIVPYAGSLEATIDALHAQQERARRILAPPVIDQTPTPPRSPAYYHCRALHRWPLGTPYTAIVSEIAKIVSKPPLVDCTLVIDASGVGRPVVDMFRQAGMRATLVPVVITAGMAESFTDGVHHVAKVVLVSAVQVLLQSRRLRFAEKMPFADVLVTELQNFRVKVTQAANETFNAREGEHDDLVLAVALASWWGERPGREFKWW